jgi:hypothetical protein
MQDNDILVYSFNAYSMQYFFNILRSRMHFLMSSFTKTACSICEQFSIKFLCVRNVGIRQFY